jgi:hypothetical protein
MMIGFGKFFLLLSFLAVGPFVSGWNSCQAECLTERVMKTKTWLNEQSARSSEVVFSGVFQTLPPGALATVLSHLCEVAALEEGAMRELVEDILNDDDVLISRRGSVKNELSRVVGSVQDNLDNSERACPAFNDFSFLGGMPALIPHMKLLLDYAAYAVACEIAEMWRKRFLVLGDRPGVEEADMLADELQRGTLLKKRVKKLAMLKFQSIAEMHSLVDSDVEGFYTEEPTHDLISLDEDWKGECSGVPYGALHLLSGLEEEVEGFMAVASLSYHVKLSGKVLALFIRYCLHPEEFERKTAGRRDSQDSGGSAESAESEKLTVYRGRDGTVVSAKESSTQTESPA